MDLTKLYEGIIESLQDIIGQVLGVVPSLLFALLLLLVGWILARVVMKVIVGLLSKLKIDELAEKLDLFGGVKVKPSAIVGKFAYWLIMLIFFLSATDTLGLDMVAEEISNLIGYLPDLFSALLIFGGGLYLSSVVRDLVASAAKSMGVGAWQIISTVVFYFLLITVSVTTLNQAGVNTDIVTSNLTIVMGGILLAFAIAYGLAARDILSNVLSSFYSKKNFQVGQIIEIDDHKGKIVKIDNISCVIDTGDEYIVVPLHRLITEKMIIHKKRGDE